MKICNIHVCVAYLPFTNRQTPSIHRLFLKDLHRPIRYSRLQLRYIKILLSSRKAALK